MPARLAAALLGAGQFLLPRRAGHRRRPRRWLGAPAAGRRDPGGAGAPAAGDAEDAKAIFLVGHDTNLANLAAMLGVSCSSRTTRPTTRRPPGRSFSSFAADPYRRQHVFVSYLAQSPEQMARTPLDLDHPPERAALFVPGCSSSGAGYPCSLDSFAGVVEKTLDRECLALPGGGKKRP